MKKRTVVALMVALCMTSGIVGLTACNGNKNPPDDKPPIVNPQNPTITLDKTSLSLDDYGNETLTATVKDAQGNPSTETVVWTSSDETVAKVTNGAVQAQGKSGSATITATAGEISATCTVSVEAMGKLPQVSGLSDISIIVGAEESVTPKVNYGKDQEEAQFTYTVANTEIATVDASGKITAKKYGDTTLTVEATWRGFKLPSLTKTINLAVRENVAVSVTGDPVTIYTSAITVDEIEFKNTAKFGANILVNGSAEGLNAEKITWASSDPTVATVDNQGNVTVNGDKKEGTTEITVSYETEAQKYTSEPVVVTVSYPVIDKTESITLEVEAVDGITGEGDEKTATYKTLGSQITAAGVFGAETSKTIVKVTDDGDTTDIRDSATWLPDLDAGKKADRTVSVLVYNDEYAYKINVFVATKFITTYSELLNMQIYGGVEKSHATVNQFETDFYTYSGWFELKNNITVLESDPVANAKCSSISTGGLLDKTKGFQGTFQGNGYTIANIRTGGGGIFGDIGQDATVRDLGIIGAQIVTENSANGGAGVLCYSTCGTITNLYVSFTTAKARSGVFGRLINGGKFTNVVIYNDYMPTLSGTNTNPYGSGSLTSWQVAAPTYTRMLILYSKAMAEKRNTLRPIGDKDTVLNSSKSATYEYVVNEDGTFSQIIKRTILVKPDGKTDAMSLSEVTYKDPVAVVTSSKSYTPAFFRVFENNVAGFRTAYADMDATISQTSLTKEVGEEPVLLTATATGYAGATLYGITPMWSSSDPTVATVENGKVTFLKAGTATITAIYKTIEYKPETYPDYVETTLKTLTCEVTVNEPSVQVQDKTSLGTLELEAKNENGLKEQLAALVQGGGDNFLEGVTVTKIALMNDRETALDNATWLAAADTGSEAERTKTLLIYGTKDSEEVAYSVSVVVVTKFISTYEELTKLQEYGGGTDAVTANNTYHNYGGYFVLTRNITVEDTAAAISPKCIGTLSSGGHMVATNGFMGTFDGRGYSIINAKFGAGGLFGDIGNQAVIKNLGVVNASITEEANTNAGAGVLGFTLYGGTVENVFVSYNTLKARSGVFGRAINGGTIKNVAVYYTYTAGYSGGSLTAWVVNAPKYDNVKIVYSNAITRADQYLVDGNKVNTTPLANVAEYVEQADGSLKAITSKAADKTVTLSDEAVVAETEFASFATEEMAQYWDVSGAYPVFKNTATATTPDPEPTSDPNTPTE